MIRQDKEDSQLVFDQLWEPIAGTEIPESLRVRPPPLNGEIQIPDQRARNPEIDLRPLPFNNNIPLHYEIRPPGGLNPQIPPVGHSVPQSEESKVDLHDWRKRPTADPLPQPVQIPVNNDRIEVNNDETEASDGWIGVDHVLRYSRRSTRPPDHLRDYDCANMVEVMLLSLSIEQEHLNLDSWGKPLSYRTATQWTKCLQMVQSTS